MKVYRQQKFTQAHKQTKSSKLIALLFSFMQPVCLTEISSLEKKKYNSTTTAEGKKTKKNIVKFLY